MDVSFSYFISEVMSSPMLFISALLTLSVIFVNGWTDAPNAIATCITTRCLSTRKAIIMSAVFNFLGVLIMTHINASVASTISNMVDFGSDTHTALVALSASLFSIVVYSTGASWLCYYHALQDGPASVVAPIDKLSILVTVAFSYLVFHERLTRRSGLGLALIVAGTLAMLI